MAKYTLCIVWLTYESVWFNTKIWNCRWQIGFSFGVICYLFWVNRIVFRDLAWVWSELEFYELIWVICDTFFFFGPEMWSDLGHKVTESCYIWSDFVIMWHISWKWWDCGRKIVKICPWKCRLTLQKIYLISKMGKLPSSYYKNNIFPLFCNYSRIKKKIKNYRHDVVFSSSVM